MEELKSYQEKVKDIKKRLNDFKNLSQAEQFKEFLFCLLTPQSNAQKCWSAVEEISKLKNPNYNAVHEILKTRTRFHKTKTSRILNAFQIWQKIKDELKKEDIREIRNFLVEKVNGYGLKEASHFLRNIGKSNNKIAILDRHILRNLFILNLILEAKIKSKKNYLEIEKIFPNYSEKINIPADELDLLWWSKENGEIFK